MYVYRDVVKATQHKSQCIMMLYIIIVYSYFISIQTPIEKLCNYFLNCTVIVTSRLIYNIAQLLTQAAGTKPRRLSTAI